jgi:hypothetical protein
MAAAVNPEPKSIDSRQSPATVTARIVPVDQAGVIRAGICDNRIGQCRIRQVGVMMPGNIVVVIRTWVMVIVVLIVVPRFMNYGVLRGMGAVAFTAPAVIGRMMRLRRVMRSLTVVMLPQPHRGPYPGGRDR